MEDMMNTMAGSAASKCEPKRQTAASDILDLVNMLAERSQKVAEHLDTKLTPITMQSTPQEGNCKEQLCREYPPLFGEVREGLLTIETSLNRIDNVIDRTEL